MSILSDYIKGRPEKSRSQWADEFGISRPHLHCLLEGSRLPSLDVATRIAVATGGAVPISSWPNIAAVLAAAQHELPVKFS